MKRMRRRIKY